jgi:hypothetical protein
MTSEEIPYLVPEIVLLYKAKNVRENDERDFEAALPSLSTEQKTWMRRALDVVHPGHAWSAKLS